MSEGRWPKCPLIPSLFRSPRVALVAVLALACSCRPPERTEPKPKPNVVVVLIDTLRPDYLDLYGYPRSTAPFLSELAKTSAVFEQAFSTSSWTVPSVASIFTSAYPHEHGVVQGLMAFKKQLRRLKKKKRATVTLNRLPQDVGTLSEQFKMLGYSTFGIAANVNLGPDLGFQRGFDRFFHRRALSIRHVHRVLGQWKEDLDRSKPFLAYIHVNDVHSPFRRRDDHYEAPSSEDPRDVTQAEYVSEIGFVDEFLEKIHGLLGEDENTIFVFLSDHGEEFWDHGGTFHGATLYRELTHVLMMFHSPARSIAAQRISVNVSLIDVLPTLVDLVGGELEDVWSGRSLRPILENAEGASTLDAELRERTLYAHLAERGNARHRWAAIDKDSYLIETTAGESLLFESSDVRQTNDVFEANTDRADDIIASLEELKTEGSLGESTPVEIELDEELVKTLRALGYIEQ